MKYPTSTFSFLTSFLVLVANPSPAVTNVTFKADLTVREAFDSNVYLQDAPPNRTVVTNAAPPHRKSFVTSVTPRVGLEYKPCPAFNLVLGYAPEVTSYHSASSEDYVAHRGTVNFAGKIDDVLWEQGNSLTWIDGNDKGLYFGGPGGAPAIGGIPIRDRRAAFIYRGGARATFAFGKWFVRPVTSAYVHDFFTKQLDTRLPQFKGYENYVDRNDVNGGLDAGYEVCDKTRVFAGYRYGFQDEGSVVTEPFEYDNEYHRVLVGIEGQPLSWLKIGVAAGPDFHHSTALTRTNFNRDYLVWYVDSAVTILPSKADTIVLTLRQYTQPAFASCSVYQDTTYDASWRHRFDEHLSATAGFRAYVGDWRIPVKREDWIYTASAGMGYAFDAKLSIEAAYSYDWVDSPIINTAGREFTRHIGSLSVKYVF